MKRIIFTDSSMKGWSRYTVNEFQTYEEARMWLDEHARASHWSGTTVPLKPGETPKFDIRKPATWCDRTKHYVRRAMIED